MQVEQINAEGLKREYKITVEASVIDEKINEKIAQIAKQIRLPGFRPGKVPAAHVKKLHGQAVMGEVLEETVNTTSREALAQDDVRPALQPDIEVKTFEEGADLEYEMSVEIMPEIEQADFSQIALTREVLAVTDEEIDDAVANIAEQQRRFEKAEDGHKAQDGDAVIIDFTGKVDDEAFEGGAAEDYQLIIGSGSFIPGFEEQLVGVVEGDDKDVKVAFPDEYGADHLAGKDAVFEVKVKEVQVPAETKIDDEFAQQMGMETLEALRKRVSEQIGQEFAQIARMKLKRELLDRLAELHEFDVPPGMLEMEFEQMWQDHERQKQAGAETGSEADAEDVDEEDLKAEYRDIANRRVRLGLLLSDIGDKNSITVTAEELNGAMMREAQRYPGQEQQVFQFYQQNPEALQQLRAPLYEEKVVDFILEMAKVEETEVDKETLMRDPDDEGAPASSKKKAAKKPATKKAPTKKAAAKKPAAKKAGAKGAGSKSTSAAKKSPAKKKQADK